MSQLFLDPRSIPSDCPVYNNVPATLPPRVRALGHLPDLAQLLPGDLILFSPTTTSILQKKIQEVQHTGGYHEDDARWTHAAVYLGSQFSICDATAKGVLHNSLLDSLSANLVRVRRDPHLDSDSRWRIALSAALQIGTPYGIRSALTIWIRSIKGLHTPQKSATRSRSNIICSELFQDAFFSATGRTLQWNHPGKEVSPALLSYVAEQRDVPVRWLRL